MKFHDFVQKLSPAIRADASTSTFTKTIFDAIITDENAEVLDSYKITTFKSFYNGKSPINRIALKINRYVEPELFSQFIMQYPDSVVDIICQQFSDVLPDINPHNAGDLLADLFSKILTEAAGTNKKSTQKGAMSGEAINTVKGKKALSQNAESANGKKIKVRLPKQLVDLVERMPKIVPSEEKFQRAINAAFALTVDKQQDAFKNYIDKAVDYYSQKKTLLYKDKPRPFYDFYVCNDLEYRKYRTSEKWSLDGIKYFIEATVPDLESLSQYLIIEGTGGIGKSMFLTHLFLSSAKTYSSTNRIPVFVSLKDYKNTTTNMTDFICSSIKEFEQDITKDTLIEQLENKRMIILLDGLDEIQSSVRAHFDRSLESLIKAYPGNTIIMSSRPVNSFVSYTTFTLLDIQPLTKEQALQLIDKYIAIDISEQESGTTKEELKSKQQFRENLNKDLYDLHHEFISNPLLLTIMMMTYSIFGEVPERIHVFYSKAYETMARLHDATKGYFQRPLHTGLTPEEFAKYFSEFCARTYEDEWLEFTEQEFSEYMDKVIKRRPLNSKVTAKDFLNDLTDNLCLMYREGDSYFFIHRSFQEYFAAVYFASDYDSNLINVGRFFESTNGGRSYSDKTFNMLYDMIPEKIERFIFLPYLEKKFSKWQDSNPEEVYWNYLDDIYSSICIEQGMTDCDSCSEPESFLYQFIVQAKKIESKIDINDLKWPQEVLAFTNIEWTYAYSTFTDNKGFKKYPDPEMIPEEILENEMLIDRNELSLEYEEYFGEPKIVGRTIEINVYKFRKQSTKYTSIRNFIAAKTFPLREEYEKLKTYFENLKYRSHKKKKIGRLFND